MGVRLRRLFDLERERDMEDLDELRDELDLLREDIFLADRLDFLCLVEWDGFLAEEVVFLVLRVVFRLPLLRVRLLDLLCRGE